MNSNIKENLAVVMAADNSSAFALAVALLSFKANSPRLFSRADFIVYTQDMDDKNKTALQKICKINFKNFQLPFDSGKIKTIKTYTELTLARYECFYMLRQYADVLWLDIDILITKELINILSHNSRGIALAQDLNFVALNFLKKPDENYNLRKRNFNAGVMLLSDNLPNCEEFADWCYDATQKYATRLRFPDQAIINLALQRFHIKPTVLPANFNAHPFSATVKSEQAYILHAMGKNKFWTNCPMPRWFQFYGQWLRVSGAPMPVQNISFIKIVLFKLKLIIEKVPFLWNIFNFLNKRRFKKMNSKVLKDLLSSN
jgi:lipopolysaccharide biosynthesis glycosyltransferase